MTEPFDDLTPSQTVGPYLTIGLLSSPVTAHVVEPDDPRAVVVRGVVLDGAGDPVPDGVIETWQANGAGRYAHPADTRNDAPLEPARLLTEWPGNELAERPEFEDLVGRIYPSRRTVTGADYVTHMSTRSQCRMLAEPIRERLFAALTEDFDDVVPLAIDTVLYLARRKPEPR